jgi:cyclohexadieny/prephenate dehydrogenase
MQPRRLSILGVGLLGGSIGLAVRSKLNACAVAGYGHRRSTLEAARAIGAVDEVYDSPAAAVRGADLVILCTPVGTFPDLLRQIAPALADGAVVTDVGSTKASVVEAAGKLLPPRVSFVGSHPMAGSEKRGVEFARADLLAGALCIVTPDGASDPDAVERVESFWRRLEMRTARVSPAEHDRRLADVSHLPHALAAALIRMQEDASFTLAGRGFADTTRIAAGDAGLWRDILLDNRANVIDGIERLGEQLALLATALRAGDGDAVKGWLDSAAQRRARLRTGEA